MPTKTYGPFTVVNKRVNTKIRVKAGDRIGIMASGKVDFGAGWFGGLGAPILTADGDNASTPSDYPAPNLRKNSLICDIDGTFFQGGVNTSFTPTKDGVVILAPNDAHPKDNSRGWSVIAYHSYPDAPGQPPPDPIRGVWHFQTLDGVGGILGPSCGRVPSAVVFNNRQHVFYSEHSGGGNLRHLDYLHYRDFRIEVLDGNGGPNGRTTNPVGGNSGDVLAIVRDGRIHVFYFDMTVASHELRHAAFDGTTWQFEYLDGQGGPEGRVNGIVGGFGQISGVVAKGVLGDAAPQLHLFYFGSSDRSLGPGPNGFGEPTGVLRHAWLPASGRWQFEVLDGKGGPNGRINTTISEAIVGHHSAAMVDQNGGMHIFYSHGLDENEERVTNLRHAWQDSRMDWHFEPLDGRGGPNGRIRARVGTFPAAILFENKIHVFYQDLTYENVRHGVFDGSNWSFKSLDGTGGPNGRVKANVGATRMGVAALPDQLSLFYWDATNANLRHAFWKGTNWQFETLDGEGGTDGRISGAVGWESSAIAQRVETPQIPPSPPVVVHYILSVYYHDGTNTDLRHAEFLPA